MYAERRYDDPGNDPNSTPTDSPAWLTRAIEAIGVNRLSLAPHRAKVRAERLLYALEIDGIDTPTITMSKDGVLLCWEHEGRVLQIQVCERITLFAYAASQGPWSMEDFPIDGGASSCARIMIRELWPHDVCGPGAELVKRLAKDEEGRVVR